MNNKDEAETATAVIGESVAVLQTNLGEIEIKLFGVEAPKTVENFKKLAGEGFYNGVKFHRVIKGFMVQGGDPLTKDDSLRASWGTGGPGYMFEDEIYAGNANIIGTIAMANSGPNTNGSQFFINLADNNFLDQKHTVFGKVVAGMETVKRIGNVETTEKGVRDIPAEAVVIEKIILK
ncbi:MAG: peptidylprolyl isomerase [Candidatus Pacebacteria bacterium]|nr:peptidylprolyl isomerase [Candidatus Paceibacterota bacterium]